MSLISNNLKYLRRINGLTQEQFARRIGTKRANVGAYEESRAIPPVDTLRIIANTFGITVDDFVKKDIRKLRETPDITFEFEPKQFYASKKTETQVDLPETDPFDIPINRLPNNSFQEPQNENIDSLNHSTASIGDLMDRFLSTASSEKKVEIRATERIAQSINLKPNYEQESANAPQQNTLPNNTQTAYYEPYKENISLVRRFQFNEYLVGYNDINFLRTLPLFRIPTLPTGAYRAFEAGEDFSFEGALIVGSLVINWHEITDGKNYILLTKSYGIIYRRVYNQIKIKGTLLLSTDNNRFPSSEISFSDVLETWEIKAFISHTLPEPTTPYNKLGNLVDEMKFELERIKK